MNYDNIDPARFANSPGMFGNALAQFQPFGQQNPTALTTIGQMPSAGVQSAPGQTSAKMPPPAQPQMNAPPMNANMMAPPPQQQPLQQQFSHPSKLSMILGTLGDSALAASGRAPIYGPAMEQRRQQEWQMGKQGNQQALEFQRELALEKYKADQGLVGQDDFTRALAAAGIDKDDPRYASMALKRADMLTNPVQLVSDGMGGMTAVRAQSAAPSGPVGPNAKAINALRQNPHMAADFDAKFGAGASARILTQGGPAQSAPATFP